MAYRREYFNLADMADLSKALVHHETFWMHIKDWGKVEPDVIEFLDKVIPQPLDSNTIYRNWGKIEFHILDQMWPSTAGGWGGMGGASMTSYQTVVIEAYYTVSVYWEGVLAYVVKRDDDYMDYVREHKYRLPSMDDVSKELNVVYKNLNRQ